MAYSLPGSSVHGAPQPTKLERVAISFTRDLPDPGTEPASPALAGRFFPTEPPGKPWLTSEGSNGKGKNHQFMALFKLALPQSRWLHLKKKSEYIIP